MCFSAPFLSGFICSFPFFLCTLFAPTYSLPAPYLGAGACSCVSQPPRSSTARYSAHRYYPGEPSATSSDSGATLRCSPCYRASPAPHESAAPAFRRVSRSSPSLSRCSCVSPLPFFPVSSVRFPSFCAHSLLLPTHCPRRTSAPGDISREEPVAAAFAAQHPAQMAVADIQLPRCLADALVIPDLPLVLRFRHRHPSFATLATHRNHQPQENPMPKAYDPAL